MAIGNPVSYWYGTKAQYNAIQTKLEDTLYFITDEHTIYKGDLKFAEGVEQLVAMSDVAPSGTYPAQSKYFNTTLGKILIKKSDGTWGDAYYPVDGSLYYDKGSVRFVHFVATYDGTTITGGSMANVYDAGVSGDSTQGVSVQGTGTVTVANASVDGKGVVKIGDNIKVSNGVISVDKATASVFGVVKIGDNITVTNGVISVSYATSAVNGVVKLIDGFVASNLPAGSYWSTDGATKYATTLTAVKQFVGAVLDNSTVGLSVDGTTGKAQIANASASQKGVVQIGTNIDVDNGVISVKTASTSDPGIVQLVNDASSSDMGSQTRAITPHAVGQVADGLTAEINTKQDILTNETNAGDGIIIESNKIKADIATVEEVVKGTTGSNLVDADGLTGALSLGQAVDVSCEALAKGVTPTYSPDFLYDFYLEKTNATSGTYYAFGFQTTATKFPKSADGLKYLAICDVRNSGTVALQYGSGNSRLQGSGYGNIEGKDKMSFPQAICAAGQTQYTRLYCLFRGNEGLVYLQLKTATAGTLHIDIKNWRQYEVTNLTDEAIAYLAQLENPDDFFRSSIVTPVLGKYLVKQDMVSPWIPTINMPDNSAGLTVGAGLSYKIKYTKTGTYSVSVDTIPTDAYGWDAHIQMFVKDTAIVQFQAPLILMDALTPNSGHNLSVKFRNGNALVYVDDTNAGTMVYLATGTTTTEGSLPYALSQTPPSEDATFTNFVVFSPELNGTVCSVGTMSNVGYSASLIGNGDDNTIVGGTIGLASGKYLAVQDVNLNDLTITSGTLNIGNNVKVTGTTTAGVTGSDTGSIVLDESCLLDFSDQTNNVPITGASISSVSGARAIPYGETESEEIVAGTGNAVNKYGKCGYLVASAADTTATGTLYDALIGGGTPYSNVCFDPALDGQTVNLSSGVFSTGRSVGIRGNGQANTKINAPLININNKGSRIYFHDLTYTGGFSVGGFNSDVISFENCKLNITRSYNGDNGANIQLLGSTITAISPTQVNQNAFSMVRGRLEDCLVTGGSFYSLFASAISKITNTTFSDYATRMCIYTYNQMPPLVENCRFERLTSYATYTPYAIYVDGNQSSTVSAGTISNCYFDTSAPIYMKYSGYTLTFAGTNILNSTVSGAGTIAFADGATVTSTPVAEGQLGTGVISTPVDISARCCIENITISGVSVAAGSIIRCSNGCDLTLHNVAISGNIGALCNSTSHQVVIRFQNVNSDVDITNWGSLIYIQDCDVGNKNIGTSSGVVVLSGDVTADEVYSTASEGYTGKIVITPGTILRINVAWTTQYRLSYFVGTYAEPTTAVKTTGNISTTDSNGNPYTATLVFNGSTVSISGSGTTIDATGIHGTPTT